MNKEGQQEKIIKISTKDLIDYGKKIGIKDMSYNDANYILNKVHKKFGVDKEFTLEEFQESKKMRDKAAKLYEIENDPKISDEEMLKKLSSIRNKK